VFFYVDDMAIAFRPEDSDHAHKFKVDLMSHYKMTDEGDLRWFLGVRIIRDREQQKIWLSQQSYIEKLAHSFKIRISDRMPQIPIGAPEPRKNEKEASAESIHLYQRKVGSLLYAAVVTRPDIARAASKLSEFLKNPSDEHHEAADQCLRYLYATRHLAIEYDGMEDCEALLIASDASFADDDDDRKSSQGYLIKLFGGPVAWKASKQATVTTSTTEAELLALEHTVKEGFALKRLFRDIQLEIQNGLKFHCDNTQTIRLVVDDNARLRTRLRHVDIQNMWLKQEYKKAHFQIAYLPTAEMPADGLTKALPKQKFDSFVKQLGLVNIKDLLEDVAEEDSEENSETDLDSDCESDPPDEK
jgi:hypothetical protein